MLWASPYFSIWLLKTEYRLLKPNTFWPNVGGLYWSWDVPSLCPVERQFTQIPTCLALKTVWPWFDSTVMILFDFAIPYLYCVTDIRRRIELLQEFNMPHVSNLVKVTRDSQYIITAGTYKPRLRVYDTNMMSLKYEKIMDSHAIQLVSLEDDYSKVSNFFEYPGKLTSNCYSVISVCFVFLNF